MLGTCEPVPIEKLPKFLFGKESSIEIRLVLLLLNEIMHPEQDQS